MRQLLLSLTALSISRNSTRASQQRNMPSNLNARSLTVVMLTALLLCAHGAPVEIASTVSPGGEYSGEEEMEPTDLQSNSGNFTSFIGITLLHQRDFTAEFHRPYDDLREYKISSIPAKCPATNFSKEACLKRLVEGLQTYKVLLKYVESEYPNSRLVPEIKLYTQPMIELFKGKMKNSQRVKVLTSNQEKQLLKNINNSTDPFQRKMTAHSILYELHYFLRDGQRSIDKREQPRRNTRSTSSVNLFYQILK